MWRGRKGGERGRGFKGEEGSFEKRELRRRGGEGERRGASKENGREGFEGEGVRGGGRLRRRGERRGGFEGEGRGEGRREGFGGWRELRRQ